MTRVKKTQMINGDERNTRNIKRNYKDKNIYMYMKKNKIHKINDASHNYFRNFHDAEHHFTKGGNI